MSSASERQVNLALFLASRRSYVTAAECRSAGLGYPEDQDDTAFLRMFERDKETLRAMGIAIDVSTEAGTEAYRINPLATFAPPLDLTPREMATLRTIAGSFVDDPSFPFRDDLMLALSKLQVLDDGEAPVHGSSCLARDEQDELVQLMADAIHARKTVTCRYTNAHGLTAQKSIDPYGLHLHDGRWYVTGYDHARGEIRTFTLARMTEVGVNSARPHTPDFNRPSNFDIRDHKGLPFQYGEDHFEARLHFSPETAWRAVRLARTHGATEFTNDGSAVWSVTAASLSRLAAWIVEAGPGVVPLEPPKLVETYLQGLHTVVKAHG